MRLSYQSALAMSPCAKRVLSLLATVASSFSRFSSMSNFIIARKCSRYAMVASARKLRMYSSSSAMVSACSLSLNLILLLRTPNVNVRLSSPSIASPNFLLQFSLLLYVIARLGSLCVFDALTFAVAISILSLCAVRAMLFVSTRSMNVSYERFCAAAWAAVIAVINIKRSLFIIRVIACGIGGISLLLRR